MIVYTTSMSQVFKYIVPFTILKELLDKICEPGQEYIIDNNVYKRMKFHGYHTLFLEALVPYYHWSKRFYVERECTYTSFMTIVRQICRTHDTEVRSNIHYGDSRYSIAYMVAKPLVEASI
jgi:hypothetical protein